MSQLSRDTVLVVWRRDLFADSLGAQFGARNVVTSEETLMKALGKGNKYEGVVVLTELGWRDGSRLDGIELVRTIIRPRLKSRLPVLFVSFLSRHQIVIDAKGRERVDRKLLGAVGHDLERMPITPTQLLAKLGTIEPLNELQFVDVVNNLCDVRGLLGEVIHSIQGKFRDLKVNQVPVNDPAIRSALQQSLQEIANLLGNSEEVEIKQDEILRSFDREVVGGATDLDAFLIARGEELKSLVLDDAEIQQSLPVRPLPWTVLILDDEPLGLTPLLQTLEKRGIRYVVSSSVHEAERLIESDFFNDIVLAISDYRLHENVEDIQRQQRRQGYDFLFELTQQDRIIRLVALSGLSRRFLLESFKRFNTRVDVFSKNYLRTEGALNLFADTVLDFGNEAYASLCSQPTASGWAALRPLYLAHRASQDYKEAERIIAERARLFVLRIEEIYQSPDQGLLLNSSLEELDDLQSDLKVKHSISAALLKRLRNKLVARRIALWLFFVKDFEPIKIYAALTGRLDLAGMLEEIKDDLRLKGDVANPNWAAEIDQKARTRLEDRAKPLLNKLALALSEFPLGLLVEEKQWFKYDMGIGNLYDRTELKDQVFYFVQLGLDRWTQVCPDSVPELRKRKAWPSKGTPRITSWGDARRIIKAMNDALTNMHASQFRGLVKNIRLNISANVQETDEVRAFLAYLDD